jgi:chromosome segregation ATPase
MNVSSTPPDDDRTDRAPDGTSLGDPTAGKRKRPIGWMIVAGLAVLLAIGLGIWAVKVNSDLDSTQSELAAQTAAADAAEAQAAAQAEAAAAVGEEIQKINADNEIYVVSDEDVAQAESEIEAAEEAVAEANAAAAEANENLSAAQDQVSTLRAELEQARAERELARAERQQARICARGSLGALGALSRNDPETASEVETISSACAASVPE